MGRKATPIDLAPPVRSRLIHVASSPSQPYRRVFRAKIILRAGEGLSNTVIAQQMNCTEKTVRKWRDRFANLSTEKALDDAYRSGRPCRVPVEVRYQLISLACNRPNGVLFRRVWSLASLSDELYEHTQCRISRSEISRLLNATSLRPHRVRMWLHSPDPNFNEKVVRICSLYRSPPPNATVLCVDEKTGMQALERKYPLHASNDSTEQRNEFEYIRHSTRSLIAALNIRSGNVTAHCGSTRKATDLEKFMDEVANRYRHNSVYIIWDNLNIHSAYKWEDWNKRHGDRFHFVYTPVHASWVNQMEIFFGILHRRVLKHGDFRSAIELENNVMKFINHWNAIEGHPFNWKFRGRFESQAA
jgi:transposase